MSAQDLRWTKWYHIIIFCRQMNDIMSKSGELDFRDKLIYYLHNLYCQEYFQERHTRSHNYDIGEVLLKVRRRRQRPVVIWWKQSPFGFILITKYSLLGTIILTQSNFWIEQDDIDSLNQVKVMRMIWEFNQVQCSSWFAHDLLLA